MNELKLFPGDVGIDDRGEVGFVNTFHFENVKRFYTVTNHSRGFVRAWHGHKKEAKYVTVTHGAALIGAVPVSDWTAPSADTPVSKYVLSAHKPSVLFIPAGHCNGFMSLTEGARLMFFSTSTLDESRGDDIRFDARFWDIWHVEER